MSAPERAVAQKFADDALTDDAFLDGRVRVLQPAQGYRAATDPVLLAAACPAERGERVLDVGSGAGAASFCLAWRVRGLQLEGVELSPDYAAISRRNALKNDVGWIAHCGDVRAAPLFVRSTSYDHVITNPPYFPADAGPACGDPARDAANRETVALSEWLDFCLRRLKPRGWLTVIHRAERLHDLLAALSGRAGDIRALPLWPRPGKPAKRVIVRARKESRAPFTLAPGLALHPVEGEGFTDAATHILKEGGALDY